MNKGPSIFHTLGNIPYMSVTRTCRDSSWSLSNESDAKRRDIILTLVDPSIN